MPMEEEAPSPAGASQRGSQSATLAHSDAAVAADAEDFGASPTDLVQRWTFADFLSKSLCTDLMQSSRVRALK